MMATQSFLKRYQQGEHQAVWAELRTYGPRLREVGVLEEATAVAHETMRRVRQNAEELVERLRRYDYAFRPASEGKTPLGTPGPEVHQQIARVEGLVGLLPVSLRVFYEVVGSIDLLGGHPDLDDIDYPDPLVVEPLGAMFDTAYPDWRQRKDRGELVGPFHLPIVPDDYHTANARTAAGHAYSVALPNSGVDAPILYEWHHTWFVDYLRTCFKWGGFPGCEDNSEPVPKMVHELAAGLQPF